MRKILVTGVILLFCIVLQAQEGQFYQFRMKNETKLQGSRIFIKDLENKGKDNRLDVNDLYREESNRYFSVYSGNKDKNIQNHVAWMKDAPLFTRAGSEAEADVVISGTYVLDAQTNVEENLYYERQSNVGGAIPYYEIRQTNRVSIEVIVSYRYKDKTTKYDTIQVESV
ncbi:MAG: hypothetical protein K9I34_02800, partial [Bacteroidales bacterium]|nr:hypothetical protein [Bacteroidales bacterium]